jgi:rhodanese-related sulfurtransferase
VPGQIFSVHEAEQVIQSGAQLVDVLSPDEYALDHLPGAINIPLKQLSAATAGVLDRSRPVLVYCADFG